LISEHPNTTAGASRVICVPFVEWIWTIEEIFKDKVSRGRDRRDVGPLRRQEQEHKKKSPHRLNFGLLLQPTVDTTADQTQVPLVSMRPSSGEG
jgi:hypothetical protein